MAAHVAVSGAVLAGGRSRRMGRDKRWIEIAGVSLLDRAVAAVGLVADDVHVIVSKPSEASARGPFTGASTPLLDRRPGEGPLAAIETALDGATHDVVIVVAGDHPFLEPEVLRLLLRRLDAHPAADAVALGTDRGPQPLLAAYRRTALRKVSELLEDGERRAAALLDRLEVVTLEPAVWRSIDADGLTGIDLDTPEDLDSVTRRAFTGGTAPPPAGSTAPEPAGGIATRPTGASRRAVSVLVRTVSPDGTNEHRDLLVVEEPLEIRAHGPDQQAVTVVTTLRTPGNDAELAVGWLFSEGMLLPGQVRRITLGDPLRLARPDDQITVELTVPLRLGAAAERHAVATASCGVCGRASIDELASRCAPVPPAIPSRGPIDWQLVVELPGRMRQAQAVFDDTGGMHATALFSGDGALLTLREDVGRHNAKLDAAIGRHVLDATVPLDDVVGVLSGRVGYELVAKAAMAGIPVLAAVGAATDLAVRSADRLGVTLISFLRGGGGNIHTHPERVRA